MAKEFYTKEFVQQNTYEKPTRLSFKDIEGETYGKISVIGWAGINQYSNWNKPRNAWWCKCDCGETDYFLVDKSSLEKGLTTSCGCNYKNNGGNISSHIEDIKDKIDSRYEVLEYKGQRHPCKISCSICRETHTLSNFYSLRQQKLVCSCKNIDKQDNYNNVLDDYNWEYLSRNEDKNIIRCKCKLCGVEKETNLSGFKQLCPCIHKISEDEQPCCVYVLRDQNNKNYYKIGLSYTPETRCENINKDSNNQGYNHNFAIINQKWFASQKVAYHVETLYHKYFRDKAVYNPKSGGIKTQVFDGSCELFELTKQDVIDFNKQYKEHIDLLLTERPKYVITKGEFKEGLHQLKQKDDSVWMWFPYKKKVAEYLGYDIKRSVCNDQVITSSIDNNTKLQDIHKEIQKRKYKCKVYIDGVMYDSLSDFYQQHLHLTQVNLSTFQDRVNCKKVEVWEALITPLQRTKINHPNIHDMQGNAISFEKFKEKYNVASSMNTIKKLWRRGYTIEQIIDYIPEQCFTYVTNYDNKWWGLPELYRHLQDLKIIHTSLKSNTFCDRVKRGWDVVTAYSTESSNKIPYKALIKQGT